MHLVGIVGFVVRFCLDKGWISERFLISLNADLRQYSKLFKSSCQLLAISNLLTDKAKRN